MYPTVYIFCYFKHIFIKIDNIIKSDSKFIICYIATLKDLQCSSHRTAGQVIFTALREIKNSPTLKDKRI